MNVRHDRSTRERIDRRVIGVIDVARRIVHAKTVSFDIALRSERERLHIDSELETNDDGEKRIVVGRERVALDKREMSYSVSEMQRYRRCCCKESWVRWDR